MMVLSLTLKDVNTQGSSPTLAGPDPLSLVLVHVKMGRRYFPPGCTRAGTKSSCLCTGQKWGMAHGSYWMIGTSEDFLRCPDSNLPHRWLILLGKYIGVEWKDYGVDVCLTL